MVPNPLLDLTNTDAAQSVLWPLSLLSAFAAQQHVGWTEATSHDEHMNGAMHD